MPPKASVNKSQTQSINLSQLEPKEITDDEIDELIKDITLKHPKSPFTLYIMEIYKKEKSKNDETNLIQIQKKYSKVWKKITDKEKEKYKKGAADEKEKYKKDLHIVKSYLIQNYIKEGATSYRIFLDHKLKEGLKHEGDPKEIQKEASEEWKHMSIEEKRSWNNLKKENDSWWEKVKHYHTVNSFAVFVEKSIAKAKEDDKKISFKDISKLWKGLSFEKKKKYEELANIINKERKRIREIYEMVNGIKPKRPMGAYKIFLSEIAKEGKLKKKNPLTEGKKLWNELSEEEKEDYLKKSKRIKLTYEYKKMLYKQKVKESRPKKPFSAYTSFCRDMRHKKKPDGVSFLEYCSDKWKKLSKDEREKYETKAEKSKEVYEKQLKIFEARIFDQPKKPKSSYQFYVAERYPEIQKEKPGAALSKITQIIADEWNNLSEKETKKYEKLYEKACDAYSQQLKEFNEKGYYHSKENKSKTRSQSQKKKSQKKSLSSKKVK